MTSTTPSTEYVENAKVVRVAIGSHYHDGRGFFTITFEGSGWGQSIQNLALDRQWIDSFIAMCGASDLFDCQGKLVRVVWPERPGTCTPIVAVRRILGDGEVRVP